MAKLSNTSVFGKLTVSDIIKVQGNIVWHTGNMGSGSGLDADKLDGLQASQFIRSDTGTIPASRIPSTITASLSGNASTATKLATARTITLTGDVTGSTTFDGSGNKSITTVVADDSHIHDTRYYTKTVSDGRYLPIGGTAVKAGDADTVDGLHASQFIRSDTGKIPADRMPDIITSTVSGNSETATKLKAPVDISLSGDASGTVEFDGSDDVNIMVTVANDSHTHNDTYYTKSASDLRYMPIDSVISNASNADKLGGYNPSQYVRSDTGTIPSARLPATIGSSTTGNAGTATKLATARTITLSGDASGSVSFDGSTNKTLTVAVADNSHNHLASQVTTTDEFSNSNSATVQDVLDDLDQAISNVATKSPKVILSGDATGSATLTNLSSTTLNVTVSNDSHTHDGRYYTESESNSRFAYKAGSTGQSFSAKDITLTENHVIYKQFEMDAVDNSNKAYILLCKNDVNNDVNGSITMDRTSGLKFAVKADIIVSGGTTGTPVATMTSLATAGSGAPSLRLVKCTYSSASYIALEITNADNYYESTGAFFTGRIVSTGVSLTPVLPASVTAVTYLNINPSMQANGHTIWHDGNDGAGSGLDADKLDGVQASQFIRSDTGTISNDRLPSTITSSISGNAATATKLATARTITLTGDITATATSFDGANNISISASVNNDSHTHDGRYYTETESNSRFAYKAGALGQDFNTGNLVVDNGTNSVLTVRSNDTGTSLIEAIGDAQGTGVLFVGQSSSYGGGIFYNGDGTPSFASGEGADRVSLYSNNNGVKTVVADWSVNGGSVAFKSAITGSITGNAGTATKLSSIGTTFTGTYPMAVNINGAVYSHTGVTYQGSTGILTAPTFKGALDGNAKTATWADTVDVNGSNTSSTWYDIVWHSGDTLYSSTGVEIQGSTNSIKASNVKAKTSLDLGDTDDASIQYNSTEKSIDFIIN